MTKVYVTVESFDNCVSNFDLPFWSSILAMIFVFDRFIFRPTLLDLSLNCCNMTFGLGPDPTPLKQCHLYVDWINLIPILLQSNFFKTLLELMYRNTSSPPCIRPMRPIPILTMSRPSWRLSPISRLYQSCIHYISLLSSSSPADDR